MVKNNFFLMKIILSLNLTYRNIQNDLNKLLNVLLFIWLNYANY